MLVSNLSYSCSPRGVEYHPGFHLILPYIGGLYHFVCDEFHLKCIVGLCMSHESLKYYIKICLLNTLTCLILHQTSKYDAINISKITSDDAQPNKIGARIKYMSTQCWFYVGPASATLAQH